MIRPRPGPAVRLNGNPLNKPTASRRLHHRGGVTSDRDPKSWRALLDEHGPALLLLARQYARSQADAEDAVQDGFVRFWKSRDRANDVVAYLFACVRSAALDLSRGKRRREHYELDAQLSPSAAGLFCGIEREELCSRRIENCRLRRYPPSSAKCWF